MKIGVVSENPMDYVKVALALEILAYHNKSYLSRELAANESKFSEEIQGLLSEAIRVSGGK
ncbi:MAG: hypothetical protein E7569_16130 [Ruminococcaceae bacterium]|uniref:hypothetical protein n=1 Tax=Faecalispora jeddahensis TaxID=1414721 RepID=UPI001898F749|nr:hypothetical protein [Faecalispora jeddahensis]MBE6745729.1 hypothetical protein [Oscillospiraceae bacterium]MBS5783814.1 hypothetical protein [Clostridium sp.]